MTENNYPRPGSFVGDIEGGEGQPLTLRRGSSASKRKDLLNKYNKDLNDSTDEANYNEPLVGVPHKGRPTIDNLAEGTEEVDLKGDR